MATFLSKISHYLATSRASTVRPDDFLAPNTKLAPLRWRKSDTRTNRVKQVDGHGRPVLEGDGSAGRRDEDIVDKVLNTTVAPSLSQIDHYLATIRASTVTVNDFLVPNSKTEPLRWRKSESRTDRVLQVGGYNGPGLEGGGSVGRGEKGIVDKALDTTMAPTLSQMNHFLATIRASTVKAEDFLAPTTTQTT